MKKFLLLFVMFAIPAFAGDVQFEATYDFAKASPCATPSSTNCVQDVLLFYIKNGERQVAATIPAPATATGTETMQSAVVTLKDLYGSVTFYGVARARTEVGGLIESSPTSAPSVELRPPGPTIVSISVK